MLNIVILVFSNTLLTKKNIILTLRFIANIRNLFILMFRAKKHDIIITFL